MPRIRTIKPEMWEDPKFGSLRRDSRLMFIGMLNFADDGGVIKANPTYIKSRVFPYDDELNTKDILVWLDALVSVRMLIPFSFNGDSYLLIRNFQKHQIIDKRYAKYSVPPETVATLAEEKTEFNPGPTSIPHREHNVNTLIPHSEHNVNTPQERIGREGNSVSKETLGDKSPVGLNENEKKCQKELQEKYAEVPKDKKCIHEFIRDNRPTFPDPYIDLWNLFAEQFNIPGVKSKSTNRIRKLKIRLSEQQFDFSQIIRKATHAGDFLLTSNWFTFDWIIENQENYLKLLEGNYDKKELPKSAPGGPSLADEIRKKRLQTENQN
jgi:hypothetical protein